MSFVLLSIDEVLSTNLMIFCHSNTKVKFFSMYADALEPFKQITSEAATPNAYSVLQDLDQEKTCHIAEAADLGLMLGGGLLKTEGVFGVNNGTVERASWSDVSSVSQLVFCELMPNRPKAGMSNSVPQGVKHVQYPPISFFCVLVLTPVGTALSLINLVRRYLALVLIDV